MQSKQDMKAFVINLLNSNLPPVYYYHNYKHTLYVLEKAIEIGEAENCSEQEMKLLSAAALWHDTGYIKTYKDHEAAGCELASKYLPAYGFLEDDINKVCGMIMATKIPQSPHTKLEEIIADADLEYLGTAGASIIADNFYKELLSMNPQFTVEEWNKTQISFILQHHYFTLYCKENKEPLNQAYLNALMNEI